MKTAYEQIRAEISERKIIPFSRFMELALYSPNGGYYEREKNPGRRGDFYTSVSVGNLFGELLAFQFSEWMEELLSLKISNSKIKIIEAGAHDGQLTKDILNWLKIHRPNIFEQIQFGIIEPSPRRQNWQKEMLAEFAGKIFWARDFENVTAENQNSKLDGIIFSNELLDAFPIRRFGWDAKQKKWFERAVALSNEKFVWSRCLDFSTQNNFPQSLAEFPPALLELLPDDYTVEFSPAAENWWRAAANVLQNGRLVTFDYGLSDEELFSPSRADGTLRAYFQHKIADNILANAGEQDLTAHVNFSAIRKIGEDAGLITEFFHNQAKFLTQILAAAAKSNSFGAWNQNQTRQFQTLTHPEHLGRAFRALVQSR